MYRSILGKGFLAINLFFLLYVMPCKAESIRICVWEGTQKPSLEQYRGKYRGQLSLVKYNKKYLIINVMDVEEYLFGVIGKEMGNDWPFEALKAQAVCSRTMVYYYKQIAAKKNLPFDVSDTMYHQVYGGVSSENENIVKAVEETSKQVLVGRSDKNEYNIVPPFFHACCGGHTNFASDTWGEKYELIEGVDDPYCSNAPFFTWSKTFSKIDLKSIIGLEISSIRIISFNRSGRVFQIELQGPWGKKIINADSLRMMTINRSTTFNSKKSLPSTMFTVTQKGNDFVFNGRGYGHGVGLCQWGARRMAEQGWDYTEILRHYFPSLVLAILEPSESGLLNISQVEIMNKGEI